METGWLYWLRWLWRCLSWWVDRDDREFLAWMAWFLCQFSDYSIERDSQASWSQCQACYQNWAAQQWALVCGNELLHTGCSKINEWVGNFVMYSYSSEETGLDWGHRFVENFGNQSFSGIKQWSKPLAVSINVSIFLNIHHNRQEFL